MRAAARSQDRPELEIFGIADNATSNMRYSKGKAKRGAALQLVRSFRMWIGLRNFRLYSFYLRPLRSAAADLLSRASTIEPDEWDSALNMTRVDPRARDRICFAVRPNLFGQSGISNPSPTLGFPRRISSLLSGILNHIPFARLLACWTSLVNGWAHAVNVLIDRLRHMAAMSSLLV